MCGKIELSKSQQFICDVRVAQEGLISGFELLTYDASNLARSAGSKNCRYARTCECVQQQVHIHAHRISTVYSYRPDTAHHLGNDTLAVFLSLSLFLSLSSRPTLATTDLPSNLRP